MKKISLLLGFSIGCFGLLAQPFKEAPKTKKKIRQIIEWVRPNLDAQSTKSMVSTFDRNGHLLTYLSKDKISTLNTRKIMDKRGRLIEKREGEGIDQCLTRYTYKPGQKIEETSFKGKKERRIYFYNKNNKLLEKKTYARGLELGESYQLRERIVYQYNKSQQLIGEKIVSYDLIKSKKFNTRKNVYHYHPDYKHLIKVVFYDYDGSTRLVEDYGYYSDGKLRLIISNHLKDQTVATKEFLYKDGRIWQKISSDRGIRHVEVFVDGRLIRLRSYSSDKVYRVVDYQYEYY